MDPTVSAISLRSAARFSACCSSVSARRPRFFLGITASLLIARPRWAGGDADPARRSCATMGGVDRPPGVVCKPISATRSECRPSASPTRLPATKTRREVRTPPAPASSDPASVGRIEAASLATPGLDGLGLGVLPPRRRSESSDLLGPHAGAAAAPAHRVDDGNVLGAALGTTLPRDRLQSPELGKGLRLGGRKDKGDPALLGHRRQ